MGLDCVHDDNPSANQVSSNEAVNVLEGVQGECKNAKMAMPEFARKIQEAVFGHDTGVYGHVCGAAAPEEAEVKHLMFSFEQVWIHVFNTQKYKLKTGAHKTLLICLPVWRS